MNANSRATNELSSGIKSHTPYDLDASSDPACKKIDIIDTNTPPGSKKGFSSNFDNSFGSKIFRHFIKWSFEG